MNKNEKLLEVRNLILRNQSSAAIKILEQIKCEIKPDERELHTRYLNEISSSLIAINDFNKARDYALQALNQARQEPQDIPGQIFALRNLGISTANLGDLEPLYGSVRIRSGL